MSRPFATARWVGLSAVVLLSTAADAQTPSEQPAGEAPGEAPPDSVDETPAEPAPAVELQAQACLDAFDRSQDLRRAGKLADARKNLLQCAQPACLEVLRAKCVEWLGDVNRDTPTLVLSVKQARGAAVAPSAVEVDGRHVPDLVMGRAFSVDPGSHNIRVRVGERWLERQVGVGVGQKNVAVGFVLPEEPIADGPIDSRTLPRLQVAGLATGVPGLAGLVAFAVAGGVGLAREKSLRKECAPDCDFSEVLDIRSLYVGADIALTLGGILTITGVVLFSVGVATAPAEETKGDKTSIELRATPSGAVVVGRF